MSPEVHDLPNYDPAVPGSAVLGFPDAAILYWRYQALPGTCAIVVQACILHSLTGRDVSEAELVAEATARGWYRPETGTEPEDVGRLLELYGVSIERQTGCTLADLEAHLAAGHRIIVAVDADEIWWPGRDGFDEDLVGDPPRLTGRDANHAVEVIGIDHTSPDQPRVILNDPGHPDGRGVLVPADEFLDAWADSEYLMVYAVY